MINKLIRLFSILSIWTLPLNAASGVDGNKADYIIVGLGNAGGLLAKRLTDDKKTSVIAIHSGQNYTESFILKYGKNTRFSVLAGLLGAQLPFDPSTLPLTPQVQADLQNLIKQIGSINNPLYETGVSTNQPNANDRNLLWVIPTPAGGGSSVNAGAWCRGTNQVYSQWEAIAGPNWSPNRILNIFKNLEDYDGKTTNKNIHGYRGPIDVFQDKISALSKVFSQAMINATGYPYVLDYNDPSTPIGVSEQFQLTRNGHNGYFRVSSMTAFLDDEVMKNNGKGINGRKLQVNFSSSALRTLWNGNRAVGVEYVQNGVVKQVFANKGVIVCAGLRSSPFLMQSGVGPAALLNSFGIPVVYDNPNVGQGLADQPHVLMLFTSNPADSNSSSNAVFSQIAWLPAPGGDPTVRELRISTVDLIPGLTISLMDLCQPKSRGTVSINSPDPLAPPVVNLGELTDPSDLALLISGFQTYIKNINIQLQLIDPQYRLIFPPPEIIEDTAALTAFIKEEIGANMHFQSHCRMAPLIQGGVVDSTGKVYGTQNLYVADNSIVPLCMDGSPMASAYLIAENIALMLLGQ